jgi:hypothetical protein
MESNQLSEPIDNHPVRVIRYPWSRDKASHHFHLSLNREYDLFTFIPILSSLGFIFKQWHQGSCGEGYVPIQPAGIWVFGFDFNYVLAQQYVVQYFIFLYLNSGEGDMCWLIRCMVTSLRFVLADYIYNIQYIGWFFCVCLLIDDTNMNVLTHSHGGRVTWKQC